MCFFHDFVTVTKGNIFYRQSMHSQTVSFDTLLNKNSDILNPVHFLWMIILHYGHFSPFLEHFFKHKLSSEYCWKVLFLFCFVEFLFLLQIFQSLQNYRTGNYLSCKKETCWIYKVCSTKVPPYCFQYFGIQPP